MTHPYPHSHGVSKAAGCQHVAVGKFSHLFPKLKPLEITEDEAAVIGGPGGIMHDFDDGSPDSAVPAAYIFFAQFVDHDITLDVKSQLRPAEGSLQATNAKKFVSDKLFNVRSASLDLDCVYGFGPEASPHLYDGEHMGVAPNGYDLPRSPTGTALIGDPRNDENIFVAQTQLVFHELHNRIFDERTGSDFAEAQQQTRFHYQWVVLFDFLKRICDPAVFEFAAERICGTKKFPLCYGPDEHGKLPMPVEFSTAAFRVGHTMVRNIYTVNEEHREVDLFSEEFNTQGFSELPEDLVPDWRFMLELDPCIVPRKCKAFDHLLADELQNLPVVNSRNPVDRALAFRNLQRASALGVPSGQDVFDALQAKGYPLGKKLHITDAKIKKKLGAVLHKSGKDLTKHTPLFFYVLFESKEKLGGERFGPVGSALLMEIFGGMLTLCDGTFLHKDHKGWSPDPCISKEEINFSKDKKKLIDDPEYFPLDLADLVRYAKRLE